jgi:hypothetical protein
LSIGSANLPATSNVYYNQPYALLTSSKNNATDCVGRYIGHATNMCKSTTAAAADVVVGVIIIVIGIVVIIVVETPPAD